MTPRAKVSNILETLGFDIQTEDIVWVKGAHSHLTHDVLERWRGIGFKDGKRVEITGLDSLKLCARGLKIDLNKPGSEYYGDYIAIATNRPKVKPPVKIE